jgi:threonine dehydrogenase-like Zn-dependent dehydrogenase
MLARQLGADTVLTTRTDALPPDRFGPQALDAAIDCTGLRTSIEFLMDRTREAVAILGVLREDVTFGARHWERLALLGYGSHNRQAAERALQLVQEDKLKLAPLVTHILPLSRYDEGIALLRRQEAVKICFLPWAE